MFKKRRKSLMVDLIPPTQIVIYIKMKTATGRFAWGSCQEKSIRPTTTFFFPSLSLFFSGFLISWSCFFLCVFDLIWIIEVKSRSKSYHTKLTSKRRRAQCRLWYNHGRPGEIQKAPFSVTFLFFFRGVLVIKRLLHILSNARESDSFLRQH